MTEVVMWGVIVLAAVMLLRAIVNNRFSNQNNNAAVLTAFHDFQPKDKQQAVEVVIEEKAGKAYLSLKEESKNEK